MDEDKAKLLRSLTIDRGPSAVAAPAPHRRRWPALVAGGITIVAAVAVLGFFVPGMRAFVPGMGGGESVSQQAAAPTAPALQPVAAEPRRAGSLAASGYVVARRKATIAAEITGKVIEVLIEEGMVVQAGQVVARLDSV